MGDTTLTVDDSTKEDLEEHRHNKHYSWGEVLEGMMTMLPTVEEFEEGCTNCGSEPIEDIPMEEQGGVVQWFHTEVDGVEFDGQQYFCSTECAMEAEEEVRKMAPPNPDKVIVGGDDLPQIEIEDASFYIFDGQSREVSVPIPGAFEGEDYKFSGEPVFIYHEGDVRQRGVIEEIVHEDLSHTTLILDTVPPTDIDDPDL